MHKIIENIKVAFHFDTNKNSNAKKARQQIIECNYANNYYGDQQCQLKPVKQ
mgnify:CR=1 FL=1